ncbi:MAG: hypothetical protein KJ070_02580 [Verrucomicrobia bacterium]|nr:hypothetical protein [Verrucomicrobiota bacterium]
MELENSGATGVDLAIIQKIERFNLFASAQTAIPPDRWLESSLVIDFKSFHTDSETKALAAALILNFLIKKLGQQLAVKAVRGASPSGWRRRTPTSSSRRAQRNCE